MEDLQKEGLSGDKLTSPLKSKKEASDYLAEISRNARATFFGILAVCAYAYLTITSTTDEGLISNSTISQLPIIQTNISIVVFYYTGPVLLFILFVYFHLYLQRFWRGVAELPIKHPDGRPVDDYVYPWIISSAFLRARIPALKEQRSLPNILEGFICVFMAWWFIPILLIFFWGRFLTRQEWIGTLVHILIIIMAVGSAIGFYNNAKDFVAKIGKSNDQAQPNPNPVSKRRKRFTAVILGVLGLLLLYISYGTIAGAPSEHCKLYRDSEECSPMRTGVRLLEIFGYHPFADFQEKIVSQRPPDWKGYTEEGKAGLEKIRGINFKGRSIRFARGNSAFLVKADFRKTDLKGANLNNALLQGANMQESNMSNSVLSEAQLNFVQMKHAQCAGADFDQAILENSTLIKAQFTDGILTGARLKGAVGSGAVFTKADLRFAVLDGTRLDNANFTEAQLQSTSFYEAKLERVIFKQALLQNAKLKNANLNYANFEDANISGAIFKDVVGLTQKQIFTACGDKRTVLPSGLKVPPCYDTN